MDEMYLINFSNIRDAFSFKNVFVIEFTYLNPRGVNYLVVNELIT